MTICTILLQISFAVFCKATGFATLVGTETGGNGISSAPYMITLPYLTGTVFPAPYRSTSRGIHCSGWAMLCSDAAFGGLPWRRLYNPRWEDIRVGDVIDYRTEQSGHAIVVVEKTDEYVKVTESGMNNHALWGGLYLRWWLEQQPGYRLNTRYPE